MFTVLLIMVAGVSVGCMLRRRVAWVGNLVMPLTCLLLFLLGLEMGGNDRILATWRTIGLDAVVIAVGSVLGSVVASWLLWKYIGKCDGTVAGKQKEENITEV